jgi:hypothetical protein
MEYNLVQHTARAPFNKCYLCDDHEGPFIDCFKEQFGYGNVHICAPRYSELGELVKPGCVGLMAKLAGMIFPHEILDRDKIIDDLLGKIAVLEEQRNVTLTYEDFVKMAEVQKPDLFLAAKAARGKKVTG